jgi:hypothetical protein
VGLILDSSVAIAAKRRADTVQALQNGETVDHHHCLTMLMKPQWTSA